MSKLSEAHLHALRTFDSNPLRSSAIETIDVRAGLEVVRDRLVELRAPVIGCPWLKLTPAGRLALTEAESKQNGEVG